MSCCALAAVALATMLSSEHADIFAQGAGQGAGRGGRQGGPGSGAAGGGRGPVGEPMTTLSSFTVRAINPDRSENASYPRVIQLQHYGAARGQLLATFARRGALPIYRSTDNGESWEFVSEVRGLRGQPALYELPQRVGEFPAGTVVAGGMGVPDDPARSILSAYYSSDGGKTWQFLSTYAEGERAPYDPAQRAGITKLKPVWEPYFHLDASGRLVVFFSDERYKQDDYNQILVHRVSPDGGRTWGDVVFDVAEPDGLSRAGMSIVTRAGNGRFFMIYEYVGLPGYPLEPRSNPVHLRVSNDGDSFGDPRDRGTLIQDRWRQFLWATPYIIWSPYGGPNGTLVASGRAVMRYELGQVGNGVMINRNLGQGYWTLLETPIWYIPGPGGYSQTMIALGDGREILQLVPVDGQIRYAKFSLPDPDFGKTP